MLELSQKVKVQPYICKIFMDNEGHAIPLAGSQIFQNFYDTQLESSNFKEFYNSKGKASFSEQSSDTRSGVIYTQTLTIQFPNGDLKRSERINTIKSLKFIGIGLTNGKSILLGRNDFYQNTLPKTKILSTEKTTSITFTVKSMITSGYLSVNTLGGFPYILPSNT